GRHHKRAAYRPSRLSLTVQPGLRTTSEGNFAVQVAALARARGCKRRLLLACNGTGRSELAAAIIGAELARAPAGPEPVERSELGVEPLQHDFGGVLVLTGLVLPFPSLERAFEIDLGALLQILLGKPAKRLIENNHP